MKVLGIIPARYGSSRLEGKPLLDIAGKTMIRRVYEQCKKSSLLTDIIIATDDERIADECKKHNLNYLMTSKRHTNGTERCGEVLAVIDEKYDVIVNIQGDEPFIAPESIDELVSIFNHQPKAEIATLIKVVGTKVMDINSYLSNPSLIKVVTNKDGKALYFSRSIIPHIRDTEAMNSTEKIEFKLHIGMYAFQKNVLLELLKLEESALEKIEKLEQLRWLEHGYSIYVAETKYNSKSIDTHEDYRYILSNISKYIHE